MLRKRGLGLGELFAADFERGIEAADFIAALLLDLGLDFEAVALLAKFFDFVAEFTGLFDEAWIDNGGCLRGWWRQRRLGSERGGRRRRGRALDDGLGGLDFAGVLRIARGDALGIAVAAVDARRGIFFGGDRLGVADGREAFRRAIAEAAVELAEHDAVPAFDAGGAGDALAVDEGAVGGLQVDELVNTVGLPQKLGVEARDVGVVDDDVIAGVTTDGKTRFEDIEDEFITIVEIEGQIRHAGRRKKALGEH